VANIKGYFQETYDEMVHKVTWPSWGELSNSAVVVLVASVLIALAVWVMDYSFGVNAETATWRGVLGLLYN